MTRIDETAGPMAEGTREGADDGKAEPLPQLDRGLVRRDTKLNCMAR